MDKILLIDDDSDFTRFFLEVADLNSMSCMVVNESKDIFTLDLNCFQHIIVDLMMPGFDGSTTHYMVPEPMSTGIFTLCATFLGGD